VTWLKYFVSIHLGSSLANRRSKSRVNTVPHAGASLCTEIKGAGSYIIDHGLPCSLETILQKGGVKKEKRFRAENRCGIRRKNVEFQIQSFVVVRLYKRWHWGLPDY
jgi:hypothetical protein